MMTSGSWPFYPAQCPRCFYFDGSEPFTDDSDYEIVGFCRHPRIAMELFRPQKLEMAHSEPCRLFLAQTRRTDAG
jgi:hypothetical protein